MPIYVKNDSPLFWTPCMVFACASLAIRRLLYFQLVGDPPVIWLCFHSSKASFPNLITPSSLLCMTKTFIRACKYASVGSALQSSWRKYRKQKPGEFEQKRSPFLTYIGWSPPLAVPSDQTVYGAASCPLYLNWSPYIMCRILKQSHTTNLLIKNFSPMQAIKASNAHASICPDNRASGRNVCKIIRFVKKLAQ